MNVSIDATPNTIPSGAPRTSGSPPRMATTTPSTPTAVQLMCQPVARSPSHRPATSSTMPGCSVWMTARTATDEWCRAEKTNARLMPNRAPARAVRRSTSLVTRPPVAYVTAHTSGTEIQKRTDTPTSGGRRDQLGDRWSEPPDHDDAGHHTGGDDRRRQSVGPGRPDDRRGGGGTGAHAVEPSPPVSPPGRPAVGGGGGGAVCRMGSVGAGRRCGRSAGRL